MDKCWTNLGHGQMLDKKWTYPKIGKISYHWTNFGHLQRLEKYWTRRNFGQIIDKCRPLLKIRLKNFFVDKNWTEIGHSNVHCLSKPNKTLTIIRHIFDNCPSI